MLILFSALIIHTANAQNSFAEVKIEPTRLTDTVFMLKGAGGNIGVSAGEDGVLIIDDQFAPLAEKITAALRDINPANVTYIVNTHHHGDHTGGNEWFRMHHSATVFAHHNVRERMAKLPTSKQNALPVVTYEQGIKFHFNGETIKVMHLPKGHTDGDSVIFFENANIVHMGDLFFNGMFPFIDLRNGGSVQGYIDNVATMLDSIDDHTTIIPGHGPVAKKSDLSAFLQMMRETAKTVSRLKNQGLTQEQVLDKGLDAKWQSWSWRFIDTKKWVTTLYQGQ